MLNDKRLKPDFSLEEYLHLAANLTIWNEQLQKTGTIDSIAVQKLQKDITDCFK